MAVFGAGKRIQSEVTLWEGIAIGAHRFGGVEFMLANREIGHVHGDSLVDIPLPKRVRDELVASGQAEPHHVLPRSGWVSMYLQEPTDVDRAIRILWQSYEIAREQQVRRVANKASAES